MLSSCVLLFISDLFVPCLHTAPVIFLALSVQIMKGSISHSSLSDLMFSKAVCDPFRGSVCKFLILISQHSVKKCAVTVTQFSVLRKVQVPVVKLTLLNEFFYFTGNIFFNSFVTIRQYCEFHCPTRWKFILWIKCFSKTLKLSTLTNTHG